MNIGTVDEPVLVYYAICATCKGPLCTRAHRFFTYEGYLAHLIYEAGQRAPSLGTDGLVHLVHEANEEFGGKHRIGKCSVCGGADCARPHRMWAREGYVKWQIQTAGVMKPREAIHRADEEFKKWNGGLDMPKRGTTGKRVAQSGRGGGLPGGGASGGGNKATGDGGLSSELEDEMNFLKRQWEIGIQGMNARDIANLNLLYRGMWAAKAGGDAAKYGKMPWDDTSVPRPEPPRPTPRPEQPGYTSGPLPRQPAPQPRPSNPFGAETGQQRGYTNTGTPPHHNSHGGGQGHNDSYRRGAASEEVPFSGNIPLDEFEATKRYYIAQWEKESSGQSIEKRRFLRDVFREALRSKYGSQARGMPMPWDDVPDSPEPGIGRSSEPREMKEGNGGSSWCDLPRAPSLPKRRRRNTAPREASGNWDGPGDEKYEDTRRHFEELWDRKREGKSRDDLRELRAVMQVAWEERVGRKGRYEPMPWHTLLRDSSSSRSYSRSRSRDVSPRSRDDKYEKQKREFVQEWAAATSGMDAPQRRTLARITQAAFVGAVGERGKAEEMPWSEYYRAAARPSPCPPQGEPSMRPLPRVPEPTHHRGAPPSRGATREYGALRDRYAAAFMLRVVGKRREEMDAIATAFRAEWVRAVGVRAHDERMPWDEVLAQRRDDDFVLGERYGGLGFDDVVGGGAAEREESRERGRSGRRGRSGSRKAEKRSVPGGRGRRATSSGVCESQ